MIVREEEEGGEDGEEEEEAEEAEEEEGGGCQGTSGRGTIRGIQTDKRVGAGLRPGVLVSEPTVGNRVSSYQMLCRIFEGRKWNTRT